MKTVFYNLVLLLFIILGHQSVHGQYGYGLPFDKLVNEKTKDIVNQTGETFEHIDLINETKNYVLRGTLRVLKTAEPNEFNYLQIGKWIYHGMFPRMVFGKIIFKDTTEFDSAGNVINKVYYDTKTRDLSLKRKWTSEFKDGIFTQHIETFKNNTLETSLTMRIVDFNILKNELNKVKVPIGSSIEYRDGKVKTIRDYDNEGKLTGVKKYER